MCATPLEASSVSLVVHNLTLRLRSYRRSCFSFTFATLACFASLPEPASAQPDNTEAQAAAPDGVPSALLTATTVQRGRSVTSLDKEIRAAVVGHAPVRLRDGSTKKLSALQAAAHCRTETVECLRSIASAAGVDVVIVPALERGTGELTLNFLAFDARSDTITRVAHWQDGSEITPETHAALPSLVGALFPEPTSSPDLDLVVEVNEEAPIGLGRGRPVSDRGPGSVDDRSSLLPPLLVAGGGALLLGAGVLSGLLLESTQDDYDSADIRTREDAEAADALRSRASTQASLANVFYGLGSVALVASGAWLAIELLGSSRTPSGSGQARTRVAPWVSPQQVGVVLRHQGGVF